jgi:N-methylhydantoinase A
VHAYEVARHLGIERILFPPAAGVASSLGFLVAPISIDLVRTFRSTLGAMQWDAVLARYREMENEAREWLRRVGAEPAAARFVRRVDMRYTGQGYEVPVELPSGELDQAIEPALRESFDGAYRRRFGTSLSSAPAEALHWRLEVSIPSPEIDLAFAPPENGSSLKGTRSAWFAELGEFRPCPVHDRYRLAHGSEIPGPALIEERESTIVVGPSASASVDLHGNVILSFRRQSS